MAELCVDHAVCLDIAGTPYILLPVVHISKLKRGVKFPDRPNDEFMVDSADSVNLMNLACLKIVKRSNLTP